ncbi:hypothetical protein GCM10009678_82000 [Actinomadura kijaniata]
MAPNEPAETSRSVTPGTGDPDPPCVSPEIGGAGAATASCAATVRLSPDHAIATPASVDGWNLTSIKVTLSERADNVAAGKGPVYDH